MLTGDEMSEMIMSSLSPNHETCHLNFKFKKVYCRLLTFPLFIKAVISSFYHFSLTPKEHNNEASVALFLYQGFEFNVEIVGSLIVLIEKGKKILLYRVSQEDKNLFSFTIVRSFLFCATGFDWTRSECDNKTTKVRKWDRWGPIRAMVKMVLHFIFSLRK